MWWPILAALACITHISCSGSWAGSDAAVVLLLLFLGPYDLLPLLHEPLVDDPRHAVVPVQRRRGRPDGNPLQILQSTLCLLAWCRYRFLHSAAHSAQELGDHAVAVCGGRFAGRFGAVGLRFTSPVTGLSGPGETSVALGVEVPQRSLSGGGCRRRGAQIGRQMRRGSAVCRVPQVQFRRGVWCGVSGPLSSALNTLQGSGEVRAGRGERGARATRGASSHADGPLWNICLQTNTHHLWPRVGLGARRGHAHPLPLHHPSLLLGRYRLPPVARHFLHIVAQVGR